MYSAPIWQKENNNNNRILYEEARSVVSRKKDENGKTKTDLIRDFIDFKGDKWKYLINHPKTRMALCTSGDALWNSINMTNYVLTSNVMHVSKQSNGYIIDQALGFGVNNSLEIGGTTAINFPVQFGVRIYGCGANYLIPWNMVLADSQFLDNKIPINSSGNPFVKNCTGSTIRLITNGITSTNFAGLTYASSGLTPATLTALPETQIPGLGTSANYFLSSPVVYFRFYASGTKIGWSTDGLTWNYWNPPVPYSTKGIFLSFALTNIGTYSVTLANTVGYYLTDVTGSLANAP